MYSKRYVTAIFVLFLFMFIYEYVVHGILLAGIYSQTPTIWRSYAEMKTYMPFNYVIMLLLAIWITYGFNIFFKLCGWKSGVKFGLYLGIFSGVQALGAYYYLPISYTLALAWFVANLIECIIGGLLIGIVCCE